MNIFTREGIAQVLSQGPVTVKFQKVDGTERVMHCTIAPHLIPENQKHNSTTTLTSATELLTEYRPNPGILRVFDLDLNEWRSFRVANVKVIKTHKDLLLG